MVFFKTKTFLLILLCMILDTINCSTHNNGVSVDLPSALPVTQLNARKLNDIDANANDHLVDNQHLNNNYQQNLKPLKNIFMGIYKNYRSTYLGNRTSSDYKKSLIDSPSLWTEAILNKTSPLSVSRMDDEIVAATENAPTLSSELPLTKLKKKKKKKKKDKVRVAAVNNKNKGSVTKKDEALFYSYDGEYRYNLGPGVNLTLDMNRDIVNVNLDEDCLKDILYQRWNSVSAVRGRGRKRTEMLSKILPLFILPFLIQSAIIPFLVAKLKLLLVKSILVGKLAIFLLIVSAIRNSHKSVQSYEASPAYWASEPSRRSEIYGGYRVEGRPTTWVN